MASPSTTLDMDANMSNYSFLRKTWKANKYPLMAKSRPECVHRTCPLLTQSGHSIFLKGRGSFDTVELHVGHTGLRANIVRGRSGGRSSHLNSDNRQGTRDE